MKENEPSITNTRMKKSQIVVGLTGPIASGKSTVATMLRERGVVVIDADQVYRSLAMAGGPLWQPIVTRFGSAIVRSDGEIDRGALGRLVFADQQALMDLEHVTHPVIVKEIRRQLKETPAPVVAIEAVKLVQAGLRADIDQLWIITADPATRLQRLVCRTGIEDAEARMRMAAASDSSLTRVAGDVVIDNSGPVVATEHAVGAAWEKLTCKFPLDQLIERTKSEEFREVR